MKGPFRNKQGSSLLEVVVAIAVLGLMVAPVCSSLVLSHRLNAEAEKVLEARLLLESTVEQLMYEGISFEKGSDGMFALENGKYVMLNKLPDDVIVENIDFKPETKTEKDDTSGQETVWQENVQLWYNVTLTVEDVENVSVQTVIKATPIYVDEVKGGGNG